tara:strand:- start:12726 stop:13325 length:600 start_codon:yes stop_codon:yes gene_type:complete
MSQPFTLPDLPYSQDALAPTISSDTIGFHYGKHHAAYFNMLNKLVENTKFSEMKLEEVVKETFGNSETQKIFNNAGQAWNHILYWNQMKPGGSNKPSGRLLSMIEESFESFEKFKEQFVASSVGVFGSGWCWLVQNDTNLEILGTPNAENPLCHNKNALMGIDVWEHAYYLDYQNVRPNHVKAVLDNIINWDFVSDRLS